jgi:pilus retraction protein PilT
MASETTLHGLLKQMVEMGGSDLHLTTQSPPMVRLDGKLIPLPYPPLTVPETKQLAYSVLTDAQKHRFEEDWELDFSFGIKGLARYRANVYNQKGAVAAAYRTIPSQIVTFKDLGLPPAIEKMCEKPRGLCLVTGPTGSGKSTSLAAMLDHRNRTTSGHIITVEDPVEFVHPSLNCLVTHREVGVDTHNWHNALKNALRQAPDVILIGEIRDAETMEHAIAFSETGHLCLGTLHANSASHTMDRIVNFFPEERRNQLLMDLSANLRAIVSQRLVRTEDGKGRKAAVKKPGRRG